MVRVSIVIVCMNNLKNLYPCLDSIRKYTTISYETFVVAYLFSKENLEKVKKDYSWITIIESNEIRGFSENNNLALRQAKGEYCFVVNDDTEIKMDTISMLLNTFLQLPADAAVVSPKLIYPDGTNQVCGRPPFGITQYILSSLSLWNERNDKSKYSNQNDIFKTYNIIGAAFMIKTTVFRRIDFFDEYYFFCPEDIAVSTLLNNKGFGCYVNSNAEIIHYEGGSGINKISKIKMATNPAGEKGTIHFLSGNSPVKYLLLTIFAIFTSLLRGIKYRFKRKKKGDSYDIFSKASFNTALGLLSKQSPKEIFIRFYSKL